MNVFVRMKYTILPNVILSIIFQISGDLHDKLIFIKSYNKKHKSKKITLQNARIK